MLVFAGVPLLAIAILVAGRRGGWLPRYIVLLFVAGMAIGSTWEIGFSMLSMDGIPDPMSHNIQPGGATVPDEPQDPMGPLFYVFIVLPLVCIWDSALLLLGAALARVAGYRPVFARFRWGALAIMMLWGQAQSFLIEMAAIDYGIWSYRPTWYNPALFPHGEAWITLMPQLVWLAASPSFYLVGIALHRRARR